MGQEKVIDIKGTSFEEAVMGAKKEEDKQKAYNNSVNKLKDKTVFYLMVVIILAISFAISKAVLGIINFQTLWLKELISIVISLIVLGYMWHQGKIQEFVDNIQNQVVVLQQKSKGVK